MQGLPTETTAVAVTENTAENVSAANNIQAFLLLAGVFGAAVAAAVLMKKNKKKKNSVTVRYLLRIIPF